MSYGGRAGSGTHLRTISFAYPGGIMYFEEYTSMSHVQKFLFALSCLITISGIGILVRDHLPTDEEVRRILSARLPEKSGHTVPIEDIVRFAVFTGARVSEILPIRYFSWY